MSKSTVKEGTCYMLTLEKDKCLSHKAFTRRWSSMLYALHPVHPICEYTGLWLEDLCSSVSSSKNLHILECDQFEVLLMVAARITMIPATLETSPDTGVGGTSSNLERSESFLQNLELLSIPNQPQWRRCTSRSQWGLQFPQTHNAALRHHRKTEQVCREPNQQTKVRTNKSTNTHRTAWVSHRSPLFVYRLLLKLALAFMNYVSAWSKSHDDLLNLRD